MSQRSSLRSATNRNPFIRMPKHIQKSYSSIIHSNPKLEMSQIHINRRINCEMQLSGLPYSSKNKLLLHTTSWMTLSNSTVPKKKQKKSKPYFCISTRLLFVFIIILLNKTSYTKTRNICETYKTRGQKLQKLLFSE